MCSKPLSLDILLLRTVEQVCWVAGILMAPKPFNYINTLLHIKEDRSKYLTNPTLDACHLH